ncbi:unnamed protein product [Meganyctiphanes norvegica]|uniref:Cationic amino acid transporter C-terminal domain-containing protein n=1 Tax=Meganyctiphanes norvegica TaxID=48144 RepID=A0AAV2QGM9_MEGNR
MPSLIERLTRRKFVTFEDSAFERVLNLVDLTALGIGSTVGVGFYVLAGDVAKNMAGPAVTISFLIAAVASVFAGLCYAEFGARVPKSGSAYIYSYVCVGEFVAFIIGWNLILEYVIGAASVARGYSGYIDELAENKISDALADAMGIKVGFLSDYPDFLAFGLCFLITGVLCFGVKESSLMNNVFTLINLLVIGYVIFAGGIGGANVENWSIAEEDLDDVCNGPKNNHTENTTDVFTTSVTPVSPAPDDWGHGGFAPYGFAGIMRGAATCFFGFVGFDVIATTGEEAINPERSIPMSIALSLLFVFIAYFGMSAVITLAIPYCLQNTTAPLIFLFDELDMPTAKWIVSIGALFGFTASLFGAMFPMPRIIYAMADDGLLFRFLARVNKRFQTPIIATVFTGLFAGIMALIFNLEALVDMMSIGTLLAYTIVSLCVMLLRYNDLEISNWKPNHKLLQDVYASDSDQEREALTEEGRERSPTKSSHSSMKYSASDYLSQSFNTKGLKEPTELSATIASHSTLLFCFLCFALALTMVLLQDNLFLGDVGAIVAVSVLLVLNILNVFIISRQPQSKKKLSFKVPLVPWLPALSSFINLYLMCNLTKGTWIRFSVWMAIGFLLYFLYGMWQSTEENVSKEKKKGKDNPGLEIVIPTINIEPATPAPSQPGSARIVKKTPLPISPLVRAEQEAKAAAASTADAAAIIIGDVPAYKQKGNDSNIEKREEELQKSFEVRTSTDLELQKVLDSLDEVVDRAYADDKQEEDNVSEEKFIEGTISASESLTEVNAENSNTEEINPEIDLEKEKGLDEGDNKNESKDQEKSTDLNAEMEQKVELDALDSKVQKRKPDPLIIKSEPEESVLPRAVSAPVMTASTPPPPPPPPPNSAGINNTGSVPTTPIGHGRHPFKKLVRNASFDDIPPSLPNSPAAVRVRDKFILIPVQVPKDSDNSDDDTPTTTSLPDNKKSSVSPLSSPDLLSELKNKFKKGSDNEPELDLEVANESSISSPSSNSSSREFTFHSTSSRDLDTIRERGESKINIEDLQNIQERRKSESKPKGMFYIPNDDEFINKNAPINEESVENKSMASDIKIQEASDSKILNKGDNAVDKTEDNISNIKEIRSGQEGKKQESENVVPSIEVSDKINISENKDIKEKESVDSKNDLISDQIKTPEIEIKVGNDKSSVSRNIIEDSAYKAEKGENGVTEQYDNENVSNEKNASNLDNNSITDPPKKTVIERKSSSNDFNKLKSMFENK